MTADFIANENVNNFITMLQNPQLGSETKKTLQKLLVQEEDKLGRDREQLELTERRVHEGRERIRKMKKLFAQSGFAQSDLAVIATMEEVQSLFESFHRQLHEEIFPFCVILRNMAVANCTTFDDAKKRAQHFAKANPEIDVVIIDRGNGDSHLVKPE